MHGFRFNRSAPARTGHHLDTSSPSAIAQRLRPSVMALAVGAAVALAAAPVSLAQTAAPQTTFSIPAQPLGQALGMLARQANLQLLMSPDLVAGRTAPALNGSFGIDEALRRLLAGSGLEAVREAGVVTVRATPATPAAAQNRDAARPEQSLDAVTVLGTRQAGAPLSSVPGSLSFVAPEEIARQSATAPRVEDLIARTVPGFNPSNNGVRQIRGRTAQVFINGVPVNEQLRASSGADINLVSLSQLAGIEVSRGANSAYGFGSPGGIIALSTPRAESENLTLTSRVGASINTGDIGGSQQFNVYQSASKIAGDVDYHVGASLAYDGLEFDPDGRTALGSRGPSRIGNGREQVGGLDWNLGYNLGARMGELRLTGTAQHAKVREAYVSDNLGVYRRREGGNIRLPAGDDAFRRAHTVSLTYENTRLGASALKLDVFDGKTYTEAYDLIGGRITRDEQSNEYRGFRSSMTTPLDGIAAKLSATYGFDYLQNRYFRPVYFTDTGAVRTYFSPDVTLDSYAPYLQLNLPLDRLRLTAGVRHEEYRGEVQTAVGPGGVRGGDIRPFDITLFNAGVVYAFDARRQAFANYTQGAEISQLGRAARGAGSVANLDPQPARSNQYEVGYRQQGAPVGYSLAAFYTESDLLSSLQADPANSGGPLIPLREPRRFWGVEGTLKWNFHPQWATGGVFSWQQGERVTATGERRDIGGRDLPPVLVSAFVDYTPRASWRNTFQVDYWGSSDRFGSSTAFGEGRIDSVWLAHALSTWTIGRGELQVGLRNLFDRKYFSLTAQADNSGSSWIPEEGRRLSVSYALKW